MPLTRIDIRKGKSRDYKKALCDSIYRAMRETFNVPEDDKFMIVSEHDADDFVFGATYLDIQRSPDLVIIQVTISNTRPIDQKKVLYARMAELLAENPGVRKEDVFISLVEGIKENWSFGNGIAQYA